MAVTGAGPLRLRGRAHAREPAGLPGPEALNDYAEALRDFPALLWAARIGLLVAVVAPHLGRLVAHADEPGRRGRWATASRSTASPPTPRARCAGAGVMLLLFIVYHLLHFTFGATCTRTSWRATSTTTSSWASGRPLVVGLLHRWPCSPWACTCTTACGACCRRVGLSHPRYNRLRHAFAAASSPWSWCVGQHLLPAGRARRRHARRRRGARAPVASHGPRPTSPTGPIEKKWEKHRFDMKLVNPANKRKYNVIVVGLRPGRRLRRRVAGRARLQRQVLLLPGQPAPRPLASPPRAASTPPRTTRTTATASTASSTTPSRAATSAPARPTSTAWPRSSVNIIDQCVAQGVPFAREYGGAARQPLLRRRPGLAHVLRARPDRPAAPARRLPGAGAADRPGQGQDVPAPRDARPGRRRRPGARHRRARPGHRRRSSRYVGRRGGPGHRRLRQRLLPLDQRQGLQRHRHLARLQEGRRLRQPLLHADPPDLHPGHRRLPVASSR